MKKIGFVIPWYAENITGGAESELKGIVEHMSAQGIDLEVLTTCVEKFNSDWSKNYWKAGKEIINQVPVRRFRVKKRNAILFDAINRRLMNNEYVPFNDQETFMKEFVNCPALYRYIKKHQKDYSLFVYIPYMFSTTYYGILQCPEKSVVIPCFHEEAYIHLDIYKNAFEKAAGFIYLSKPEYELANNVFNLKRAKQAVIGAGVDTEFTYSAEDFRNKTGIQESFVLYAGRKDVGKNIYLLIQYFGEYRRRNPKRNLKLVLIGGGEVDIPDDLKDDVKDLGFVDIQLKHDACATAEVLCQPSVHESFSIVIMESWLSKRPVLVHDNCEVTKNFCRETNGGLWFKNYSEFEAELNYLLDHREIADAMGENGRKYVLEHFSWQTVIQKLNQFFEEVSNGG